MIRLSEGDVARIQEADHLVLKSGARYRPPEGPGTTCAGSRPAGFALRPACTSPWRPKRPRFTFIDLFAGIGGFRIAFEKAGGECVFTSEWNEQAQETYQANFGEIPHGDITAITAEGIPSHDILVGGFPCQPFSIAGVSKKNSLGRAHGFKDETQGTLFFDVVRILEHHRPKAFVLENVKNLRSHDKGRTYAVIIAALRKLGYHVFDHILDARGLVPQHRERIFIAGFREFCSFDFPKLPHEGPKFSSILEPKVEEKYFLTNHLWTYLRKYAEKHRSKGNGFGCTVTDMDGVARTLSARYYKDGSEILVNAGRPVPRRLTPRECANLMGFPKDFRISVSDTQAYRQFGNAVVVPVAEAVAREVVKALKFTHPRSRPLRPGPETSRTSEPAVARLEHTA